MAAVTWGSRPAPLRAFVGCSGTSRRGPARGMPRAAAGAPSKHSSPAASRAANSSPPPMPPTEPPQRGHLAVEEGVREQLRDVAAPQLLKGRAVEPHRQERAHVLKLARAGWGAGGGREGVGAEHPRRSPCKEALTTCPRQHTRMRTHLLKRCPPPFKAQAHLTPQAHTTGPQQHPPNPPCAPTCLRCSVAFSKNSIGQ